MHMDEFLEYGLSKGFTNTTRELDCENVYTELATIKSAFPK